MKTKSLFYSYWIFQLRLILSITRFFFPVSKLSLASALPLSSGFDRTSWTEINALLSTVLLTLLLQSYLVFHRVRCWDLCCSFCTLLHFQTSKVIANHSVNHQPFADDTQLQKSTPPNDVQSLTHDLQSCADDIKAWMCNNQLKLNEDKTEAILFSIPSLSSCHCLPSSIIVSTHEIQFSDKVRNLGFILDSNLTMKQHVIKICQTAYYEVKRISSIRRYLRRCSKTNDNFLCIVQTRLLQLFSHGHSELCNSTNAESPKYCCTPHSQSSTPSKLLTSPTATPLASTF